MQRSALRQLRSSVLLFVISLFTVRTNGVTRGHASMQTVKISRDVDTRQASQTQDKKQAAFNEIVYGAETLYKDFKSDAAAVNQARTAFLLCPSCHYSGSGLTFFGEMYGIDHLVDRKYMTDSIFPALRSQTNSPAYLSVGVKPYTTRYEYLLKADGASRYDTIEMDATQELYGSSRSHFVDIAQNIDKHVGVNTYDVVLANGVLGWGIDSPSQISEFFFTMARVMKPKGYFVIGYNPHIGQNHTQGIEEHFLPVSLGTLPSKVPFDIEWKHVYEFYQKKT